MEEYATIKLPECMDQLEINIFNQTGIEFINVVQSKPRYDSDKGKWVINMFISPFELRLCGQ